MNIALKADFTQRNPGIDLLRALTMFVMIFVNDLWTIHDVPHWLEHAKFGEDFMGLADWVFPGFLFVVGMSIPYAIESRYRKGNSAESTVAHILTRTFALLIMGVFIVNSESRLSPDVAYPIGVYWILMVTAFILIWNNYPRNADKNRQMLFKAFKVIGWIILLYLAITFRDPKGGVFSAKWWGILGAIGWAYLLSAMIYLFTRDRLKYLIPVWLAFVLICILGTGMNEANGGTAILSLPFPNFYNEFLHLLNIGNGALPAFTMGGIVFSILSARYSKVKAGKKIIYLVALLAVLFLAGFISRKFWILSKLTASPTWIFYASAITIALYAVLTWLSDIGRAGWLNIIKPAGTATLTCYLVPYVWYGLADLTGFKMPDWFTHGPMGLVNCLLFSFVIIGVTWLLGKVRIKLKI